MAAKKGVAVLERGSQVHAMAEFQEILDFPPAPRLNVYGELGLPPNALSSPARRRLRHVPAVRRHGYLLATFVMKPERGNQRFASASSTSETTFAASPAREFAL